MSVGWIGSAQVGVGFVSALEALEVDSSVCNEDVKGGTPEIQHPLVMPGLGARKCLDSRNKELMVKLREVQVTF